MTSPEIDECLNFNKWSKSLQVFNVTLAFQVASEAHDVSDLRRANVYSYLFLENGDSVFIFVFMHVVPVTEGKLDPH